MTLPANYKVDLEAFNGPMDLLLYLVRQSEVDVYDIPIAEIADQFLSYVEMLEALDIEYASAFLVMATTLMDIKAKMLVPSPPGDKDEDDEELVDPREELVRELLEYKKVRDAALYLEGRFDERKQMFESGADMPEPGEKLLEEVEVWDLFTAFSKLLKQIGAGVSEIVSRELPIEAYIEAILQRLRGTSRLAFEDLFDIPADRASIVGTFVALLELVRQGRIRAFQENEFGSIVIELRREAA